MSEIVGGDRARLVKKATQTTIRDALEQLGWFRTTKYDVPPGPRKHRPVTFYTKAAKWNEPIEFNAIFVSGQDTDDDEIELGSNLTEDRWYFTVDVFGESDSLSEHIIHDVRDILRGKMGSVGRTRAQIDVYDVNQATPPLISRLDIVNVAVDRAHFAENAWQAHWYSCSFILLDEYYGDDGTD